jgi:hypothetical protein
MVHYHGDGTGRDTYINRSSGGTFLQYNPVKWAEKGSFYPMKAQRPKATPNPVMEAKHIHYKPDGTGRDRYIDVNAGGLATIYGSYNLMDFKQKFVKSLRVPDRPFSAAVAPDRRKVRRDAELIKRIQ